MKVYIDTGVIISSYKPNEKSYKASLQIAKLNTITKVGSYILIVELFSTISRLYKASQIKIPLPIRKILLKLSEKERIYAIVNAMILDWNLFCPDIGFEVKQLKLKDFSILIPEALLESCIMAPLLHLKTLDLMHIAFAKIINETTQDLKYFITLDQNILNNRDKIKRIAKFHILTPQEFLKHI